MNKIRKSMLLSLSSLLSLLSFPAFAAPHVSETLNLAKGWNAVYIETTADESACEDLFRDTPVIAAAIYRSDADASTAQYDTSGKEIVQAPIVFLQWSRGEKDSALQSVVGGNTYLLFATNAATISISGVPAAPQWTGFSVSAPQTPQRNLTCTPLPRALSQTAAKNPAAVGSRTTGIFAKWLFGP